MNTAALIAALRDKSATIGIIGLGYVGLPLALTFADKGFPVVGFDVDHVPCRIERGLDPHQIGHERFELGALIVGDGLGAGGVPVDIGQRPLLVLDGLQNELFDIGRQALGQKTHALNQLHV